MSAEHIHNFYICLGNSPLAAALLALSFAEGPSYNGFVLAAVRGKTPSTYAADSGSGWVGKRPFGAELRINGGDEEKSAKRPPIYALSLPCLSNYFGHHPPLSFGLRWLFAACLHSVLRLSTAFSLRRLFRSLPPLGPGITFRLSRITKIMYIMCINFKFPNQIERALKSGLVGFLGICKARGWGRTCGYSVVDNGENNTK